MELKEAKPIPFISFNRKTGFILNPKAIDFLKSLKDTKIGIISIVGKYRTGKSFLVNRVLLNQKENGFQVGPTINPCTKGLWIWTKTLKSQNPDHKDMKVLVLDTEGFGGIDENTNHDSRIFMFSLLLSSYFIYNSVGSIDERALQTISLIVNLAKQIQYKTQKSNQEEDTKVYFPFFLWVIRDFALMMQNEKGHSITSKEYLENSLASQKGISDSIEEKNRIRRMLKYFFKERDLITLVRPIEDEVKLQNINQLDNSELRPEFVEEMLKLRKKVFKKIKPKMINNQFINPSMLVELAKAYVNSINKGSAPNIKSAWSYLCRNQSKQSIQAGKEMYNIKFKELLNELQENPVTEEIILAKKEEILKLLRKILNQTLKSDDKSLKKMAQRCLQEFEKDFEKLRTIIKQKWNSLYSSYLDGKFLELRKKVKEHSLDTFFEFKMEFQEVKKQYEKEMKSSELKENVYNSQSIVLIMQISEFFFQKFSHTSNLELKVLKQQNLLLQEDLHTAKGTHSTETQDLKKTIAKLQKDFIFADASQNNLKQNLEELQKKKLNLESQIQSNSSDNREEIGQLHQKYQEKIDGLMRDLQQLSLGTMQEMASLKQTSAKYEDKVTLVEKHRDQIQNRLKCIEQDNKRLRNQNLTYQASVEVILSDQLQKEKMMQVEKNFMIKQNQEVKREYEEKIYNLREQLEKESNVELAHKQSEWDMQKTYLENQITFFKGELENNKNAHNTLIMALSNQNNGDYIGQLGLVETNRNLSSAMEKFELRHKQLEHKYERLKKLKRLIKCYSLLSCGFCQSTMTLSEFPQHLMNCKEHFKKAQKKLGYNQEKLTVQENGEKILKDELSINIYQTMVKESKNNRPYTEYNIHVKQGKNKTKEILRKFKHFCQLHVDIESLFPNLKFPSSASYILNKQTDILSFIKSGKEAKIEDQRKGLQHYIRELSKIKSVRQSDPFKQFLELYDSKYDEGTFSRKKRKQDRKLFQLSPKSFLKTWNKTRQNYQKEKKMSQIHQFEKENLELTYQDRDIQQKLNFTLASQLEEPTGDTTGIYQSELENSHFDEHELSQNYGGNSPYSRPDSKYDFQDILRSNKIN